MGATGATSTSSDCTKAGVDATDDLLGIDTSISSAHASRLNILRKARARIALADQSLGLSLQFPICDAAYVENPAANFEVHGWTDSTISCWVPERGGSRAQRIVVHSVNLALTSGAGVLLPLELLLFTLIHELAHTLTPPLAVRRCDVSKKILAMQVRI